MEILSYWILISLIIYLSLIMSWSKHNKSVLSLNDYVMIASGCERTLDCSRSVS